jgi:hypothetical protein
MQNDVIADTLALVNVVRQAFGHEALTDLPSSSPGNSSDCLYARALRDVGVQAVGGSGEMHFASERIASSVAALWGVENHGMMVHAPAEFGEVIRQFDARRMGHYQVGGTTTS